MRALTALVIFLLLFQQTLATNVLGVLSDKAKIQRLAKIDFSDSHAVAKHFAISNARSEDLGFGWKMRDGYVSGYYICIKASFVYLHDSLVSYSVTPDLPREDHLQAKYLHWYERCFKTDAEQVLPFHNNLEGISLQSALYKGPIAQSAIPDAILKYMSPYSGTLYGFRGSCSYDLYPNRQTFQEILPILTPDLLELLLYSINPASRLTAAEYFLRHRDQFANRNRMDDRVVQIFLDKPTIDCNLGCTVQTMDTIDYVEMMMELAYPND